MKSSAIKRLIPEVFQRATTPGSPLVAILAVMEALHAPAEAAIENIEATFNPYRTPDRFVPFLARWVDLDRFFGSEIEKADSSSVPIATGLGRLRELVASAAYLSQWRGTPTGLRRFLEIATGIIGFELDEHVLGADGSPRPFHVRVCIPKAAVGYRSLIEQIIDQEKPAYVTYEIEIAPN